MMTMKTVKKQVCSAYFRMLIICNVHDFKITCNFLRVSAAIKFWGVKLWQKRSISHQSFTPSMFPTIRYKMMTH